MSYDADHPDEGRNTFVYSLVGAPAGANIDPETGEFTWTPTASQTGVNNFQIVASDSAGNSATQDVSINVESDALVNYRLEVTDLNGTVIDAIPVGEKFLIRALVEDARPAVSGESRGVFSAYFDATYTSSLASVSGDLVFSEFFTGARLGNTDTAGLIDEAGALGSTEPLGSGEFLLWSIEMTADAAGTLTIAGDAADDLPAHQTTVFGMNDPVDSSELAFLGTTLEIVSMIFAADDTATVSEDSSNNIINVTANDVVVGNSQIEVTNTTSPSNGVASPSEDGTSVVYTPNANFVGTDTFTYSILMAPTRPPPRSRSRSPTPTIRPMRTMMLPA
ncbi:MAG: Ig-like domain-containing protein [Pirellulaceae bacterium]